MVNNSNAKGNIQAILELHKENDPREQSSHHHWNPDWGSRNSVPGGWESVGDYGAYGDDDSGHFDCVASFEKLDS
jgi:hypothetical protein